MARHKIGASTVRNVRAKPIEEAAFTNTMPMSRRMLLNRELPRRRAYFEIEGSGGYNKTAELTEQEQRIGRSPECELTLQLDNISRVHARTSMEDEEYWVEDLQSTNGTYVNGVQVTRCLLRDGDVVEIGEAKMHFFEEKVRPGK